jgi:glycosyltransferase involved in cell wall biosynthesis
LVGGIGMTIQNNRLRSTFQEEKNPATLPVGENAPLLDADRQNKMISVVIPVFNSEETLPLLVERLFKVEKTFGRPFEIVLVDDCSTDRSWQVLRSLRESYPDKLKLARLVRNQGQHNAILCGFSMVTGETVVTMDDDLQNPPEELPKLVQAIDDGYELAIGAYGKKHHSRHRNFFGGLVDRVQRSLFDLPADFQLTSFRAIKRVVTDRTLQMGGVYPYVTSMLLCNVANYINVSVEHAPRHAGRSNYNMKKSLQLALNLILSYSSYPAYLVGALCAFAFLFSLSYACYVFWRLIFYGISVPGWTSIVLLLSFLGSVILFCLFIYGLYLARIHQLITRTRTSYTIRDYLG